MARKQEGFIDMPGRTAPTALFGVIDQPKVGGVRPIRYRPKGS
jgi:hypothetical protein